jgi:hypothetical protein
LEQIDTTTDNSEPATVVKSRGKNAAIASLVDSDLDEDDEFDDDLSDLDSMDLPLPCRP